MMLCNKWPCTYEASHNGKCADHRIAELEAALTKAAQIADCERWPDRFPRISEAMREALQEQKP